MLYSFRKKKTLAPRQIDHILYIKAEVLYPNQSFTHSVLIMHGNSL